jgi:N-acetylmuramoyl-L-alanine amidase
MQAIAAVIKNRVGAPGFPGNLHDVIYQKNAFSSMSRPTDLQYNFEPYGPIAIQAAAIASDALRGAVPDPTGGACYYANLKTMDRDGWFARNIVNNPEHPHTVTLGQHDFYI